MIRELTYNHLSNLNPKQKDNAYESINNFIEKEFITYEDKNRSMECLRLTEMGYNNLYKNSRDVSDIVNMIMKEYKKKILGRRYSYDEKFKFWINPETKPYRNR